MHNQSLKGNYNIVKDTWAAPSTMYVSVEFLTLAFTLRGNSPGLLLKLGTRPPLSPIIILGDPKSMFMACFEVIHLMKHSVRCCANRKLTKNDAGTCKRVSDKAEIRLRRQLLFKSGRNQSCWKLR